MLKRIFDIVVSLLLLFLFFPIILLISICNKFYFGSVFFRQWRPGLNAKAFQIIKFQTMLNIKDTQGILLPDEKRLTPFGLFLRKTSLDELPELWNVLKGDMSLVGPRPLLMEYLSIYTFDQSKRHNVRPGLTGWAQINGRNAISWEAKFKLDLWYVNNYSFWLDIKILFLTIVKVIKREGINSPTEATTTKFMGTKCQL